MGGIDRYVELAAPRHHGSAWESASSTSLDPQLRRPAAPGSSSTIAQPAAAVDCRARVAARLARHRAAGAFAQPAPSAWRTERSAREATSRRCLLMFLLMVGLHSLLDTRCGTPTSCSQPRCVGTVRGLKHSVTFTWVAKRSASLAADRSALGCAAGGLLVIADYARVTTIFAPPEDAPPLADRIAAGRRSWFFAHHADYALVTSSAPQSVDLEAFDAAGALSARSAPDDRLDAGARRAGRGRTRRLCRLPARRIPRC